jgi:Leucine-rich repeat (LRR) protein
VSDARLRALERELQLDPSDPDRVEAVAEARARRGLPIRPALFAQRVFPARRVALPAGITALALPAAGKEYELCKPSDEVREVEVPPHRSLSVRSTPATDPAWAAQVDLLAKAGVSSLELNPRKISTPALAHLSRLQSLESLSLSVGRHVEGLWKLLRELPRLSQLVLSGAGHLDDSLFKHLASSARLRRLEVHGAPKVTGAGIDSLGPRLSEVALYSTGVDRHGAESLARLPSLSTLELTGCRHLHDVGLRPLFGLGIEDLKLGDCPEVSSEGLRALLGTLTQLRRFKLSSDRIPLADDVARALPSSLQSLSASRLPISLQGFASLARLRLRYLYVGSCTLVRQGPWPALLASWPDLAQLHLWYTPSFDDEAAAGLAACPNLTTLCLCGDSLTPQAFSSLRVLSHLDSLRLDRISVHTAAQLEPLARLSALTELALSDIRLCERGLHVLGRLSGLETLKCSRAGIGGAGLEHLARLPRLTHLDLSNNAPLVRVQALTGCRSLVNLKLGSCQRLSRAEVARLAPLSATLEHLNLWGNTWLDAAGLELLRPLFPGCRVTR